MIRRKEKFISSGIVSYSRAIFPQLVCGRSLLFFFLVSLLSFAACSFDDIESLRPKSQYTVVYNANGGIGSMANSRHVYDEEKELTPNAFTNTNLIFAGWSRTEGGAIEFTDRQSVVNLTKSHNANVNLYAQWGVFSYTVAYDANGGAGEMEASSFTYGVSQTLKANEFARTGYTFAGWNTQPDGSGEGYSNGQSVINLTEIENDTVTLYAIWKINTYTVEYNANGGAGEMAASAYTYGVFQDLRLNEFSRAGYSFAGWARAADIAWEFENGQSVSNLSEKADDVITLYAQWSCTVTFNKNNTDAGSSDADPLTITVTTPADTTVYLPAQPARAGWLFNDWNTEADGSGTLFDETTALTDNITVYAQWIVRPPDSVVVIFNSMFGSPVHQQVLIINESATQPENPARNDYAFLGWFKESACVNAWNFADLVAEDITLYAKWLWLDGAFLVSFSADGGRPIPVDQAVQYNGKITTPPIMEKANSYFGGWYRDVSRLVPWFFDRDTVSADTTLYAKWNEAGKVTVNFFADDGSPVWSNIEVTRNTTITVPANIKKTGYTAVWYADHTLTTVWNVDRLVNGNTTLFAKWLPNTLTINYNGGGGAGNAPANPKSAVYDTDVTMPANTYTRSGWTFNGWVVSGTGAITGKYQSGARVSVVDLSTAIKTGNADITLTATWIAIPSISSQPLSGDYLYGDTITLSVSASAADGGTLSYQWYKNTSAVNSGGAPVGTNSSNCNVSSNEPGTFYYYVVVTNTIEAASVASNAVTIRVLVNHTVNISFASFADISTPVISAGTIYLIPGAGKPATAQITVTNPYAYEAGSIKWYLNNSQITAGISGERGETLTVSSAVYNTIGQHLVTVEVKNSGKIYSKIVVFEVKP